MWKRFLVRGPASLGIEVARNGSYNTILAAVMLDLVDEEPAPYFRPVEQWKDEEAQRRAEDGKPLRALVGEPGAIDPAAKTASRLAWAMPLFQRRRPGEWAVRAAPWAAALLRWQMAQEAPADRTLGTACYHLGLYPAWEEAQRRRGLQPARDVEKALRWDWVVKDNTARGRQVVEAYLREQEERQASSQTPVSRDEKP